MKVVILAGGFGTRLAERTGVVPKPMVEIGGRPILWHIMRHYAHQGFTDFVVALGYKSEVIKDYFLNLHALESDLSVDLSTGEVSHLGSKGAYDWNVTLINTGLETLTGGRIARLGDVIGGERFMMTYGDGVSDVDLKALLSTHEDGGYDATITAVHPRGHYGELDLDGDMVTSFMEKPEFRESWINGGFMVFEPSILDHLDGDETVLEREPMEKLAAAGKLGAYRHQGFWQCMDNIRDMRYLNDLWNSGSAPWRTWES